MNYKIDIPRKTFDGLCSFLQVWRDIYARPGAVVLKGSLRVKTPISGGVYTKKQDPIYGDARLISLCYDTALSGLGRCLVRKSDATLDLRDLTEEEQHALLFVSAVAKLKPQQTKVMERFTSCMDDFLRMPAMVRLAIAAQE